MRPFRGIFSGRIEITSAPVGQLEIHTRLDGTFDATGVGEALGICACGFLTSVPEGSQRDALFTDLVIAFMANAAGGIVKFESGSAELVQVPREPPSGKVS